MYRLLTCLTTEHDYRIVLIAVLVCAATAITSFKTYAHALAPEGSRRALWLTVTGLAAAAGIWATHFIAMLAYQPNIPVAYDLGLTALSLAAAALATTLAFAISSRGSRYSSIIGGAVLGAGVSTMHFIGMHALAVPGHVVWEYGTASFSAAIGVIFGAIAMKAFHAKSIKPRYFEASTFLVCAIAGMHFTAMSAVQIQLDPAVEIDSLSIGRFALALSIFVVTTVALAAGIFATAISKMSDQIDVRTTALRAEVDERRHAAARLAQQQAILADIMRSEKFRHADAQEAIATINERATAYEKIDVSYTYHVAADGLTLAPFHCHDRRPNQQFSIAPVPTFYFAPSGDMNDMKEPAIFTDLQSDPRITEGRLEYTRARDMRAAIDLPIVMDGRVVGVHCVRACGSAHEWTQDEKLFATSLANLASVVFERNARQKVGEELRVANAAAQAANKAKSQFLANMSHEIRTPMNGVFGMTDLLARTELSDRQKRLVDTIGQSARTLLTIINDILDISRIEEGKLSLDSHDYDLAGCVEDAVALLAEDAQKKGVDLNLFIDEDAFGTAKGDSVRLRQVMLNILGNAVKFTPQGEVNVRVTAVGEERPANRLKFEVRDTGIGIDAAVVEMLFKPFTQADSSISRRFGGTGLGLSISRHLITLMGGTVEITSELGKGTCITFELPIQIWTNSEPKQKSNSGILAGQRILVVDDRSTNREIICSYLAACGVQAEPAEGGEQALAMLEAAAHAKRPFAQAIVDLIMPDIDGLELCRRINSDAKFKSTQLILLSSLSWSQDLGVARDAGIERLLHKPIRRNELIAVVTDVFSRRSNGTNATHVAAATPKETRKFNLKVLVAEDNPVNQVIATEYLTILGCSATVVENGLQAVAAFERETFDVILMDCQMPHMDGLKATRAIREREAETKSIATPIIAVTANAFEEDRQNCFAAGMNAYIRKPFSETDLSAVLAKFQPSCEAGGGNVTTLPATNLAAAETLRSAHDCARIDETLRNSRPALYAKLVSAYLEFAPSIRPVISSALRTKDMNALAAAAHSLKSSSANVGALNLSELSRQLELAAKNEQLANCAQIATELEQGIALLCDTLKAGLEKQLAAGVA